MSGSLQTAQLVITIAWSAKKNKI